jgi:hypothetical protein
MRGSWDELRSIGDHLSVGKRSAGQSKTESRAGSAQRGLEMTPAAMEWANVIAPIETQPSQGPPRAWRLPLGGPSFLSVPEWV